MTETIQLTTRPNGVTVLTFNRPEALNALNFEMMTAFAAAIDNLEQDDNLRALIVTGAGEKAFCSGGDLRELVQRTSEDEAREFIELVGDALLRMERLPVPVIAAINGYALGGGSEIALACDMRFANRHVRMGMVQINMALTPGWGAGQRLLRQVGYSTAMELLLRGDVLKADALQSLGLLNSVVDDDSALGAACDFADDIASRSPRVVRGIKQLLRAGLTGSYDDALATEHEIFPPLWADDAHLQAVADFIAQQDAKKSNS